MARPTDETAEQRTAFATALAAELDSYNGSQADFATALQDVLGESVHQTAVSNWARGVHAPSRRHVSAIEQVLELSPGALSKLLGYVPVDSGNVIDVPTAIGADTGLTPDQRADLVDQWSRMVARTAAQRQKRRRPPAP